MKHEMRLHPVPFEAIRSGRQLIETRVYDEKRRLVKVGDYVLFLKRPDETETFTAEVIGVSIFKSFEDLFQAIDKRKFGYSDEDTLEHQLECMRKYYAVEDEKEQGVVGIHVRAIG